jgi:uncharacterized protein YhaN
VKLLNLHCIAFGCFTDAKLDFSGPDHSFHVIYGSNEAGKSTALRALTGLLYGIPARTADAFLHDMRELRLAGELQRSDGECFPFVRRKGNRDTLLDTEGKPIPDKRLLEFLGGTSEEVFVTMFSIDHDSLTRGGNDLLAGKGDVAESLFQAGTGITSLRQVLATLGAEAEQLFKPRSSTALVNRAIEDYAAANKRSRDLAVPPRQWTQQSAALEAKKQELNDIKLRLSELNARREQLNRFRLALPHVTRRKELLQQLETLGSVTLLPESAPRDREEAQRSQRDARRRKEEAQDKLDKLSAEVEQLQLPQELLAQTDAVASIYERLDSYRQAMGDFPKVGAEQSQLENDARTILSEVKPGLPLADSETLRLSVVQRTRIRTLADRHRTLQERLRGTSERTESARMQWEEKRQALMKTLAPKDACELERTLDRVRKQGDLEATLRTETNELRTVEEQAAAELKRLPLWTGTLEQLETLPVPALETVEHFETVLNALNSEQNLLNTQREENHQRKAKVEEGMQTLQIGGATPTEQDLQQARERREQGWQLIRQAWLEGTSDPLREKAFDPERSLVDAYEKSVADADVIADRLRREADRVAKLAALLADKEGSERRAAELEATQSELTVRLKAWQEQWREAWQVAGIAPLSPKEMRGWLNRHTALLAQVRDLRQRRQSVNQMEQRIEEHIKELDEALGALGEPARRELETLSALVQRSQSVLDRLNDAAQQRANLEKEVQRLAGEHEKATNEHGRAQRELEAWRNDWQQALAPMSVPADTRPEEASAVIEKLDALFKKLEDSQNRRVRAEQMEQHISHFDADVRALVQTLAPELGNLTPEQAATRLQSLLAKAQQDDVRRESLQKQIEQEQTALDNAEREFKQAERRLEELMANAHCSDAATLEEAERKSADVQRLRNEVDTANEALAGFTAGVTLEAFLSEMAAVNADRLPFEIDELEREIQTLDSQRSQLEQQVGSDQAALAAMDGSDQATVAAEEAQGALATVRAGTERYLQLRLATLVLRRQIERYRQQNQDPVIRRASEIFPRLTLGSFARLKTDFDDKDRPVLLGVRPSGKEVSVSGMSDGTRDQLFLALRLASLELQLISSEPVPFVVDDVLIKFDDPRAEATLAQLSELARYTQILFFTHHTKLVELAQKAVTRELLKVHNLGAT